MELLREDIPPEWDWPGSMQKGMCTLELLAQQALVQLQGKRHSSVIARLCQYSDNMAVVGCMAKGLCTAFPLAGALISLARVCLRQQCTLAISHLAGVRNEEADLINCPGAAHPSGLQALQPVA